MANSVKEQLNQAGLSLKLSIPVNYAAVATQGYDREFRSTSRFLPRGRFARNGRRDRLNDAIMTARIQITRGTRSGVFSGSINLCSRHRQNNPPVANRAYSTWNIFHVKRVVRSRAPRATCRVNETHGGKLQSGDAVDFTIARSTLPSRRS